MKGFHKPGLYLSVLSPKASGFNPDLWNYNGWDFFLWKLYRDATVKSVTHVDQENQTHQFHSVDQMPDFKGVDSSYIIWTLARLKFDDFRLDIIKTCNLTLTLMISDFTWMLYTFPQAQRLKSMYATSFPFISWINSC